jgi:CHAT domain-containing protein
MLFRQQDAISRNDHKVMGLAPVYQDPSKSVQLNTDKPRLDAAFLKWTKSEVDRVSEYFTTDKFIGEDAPENILINKGKEYSIIHIASHGLVNDIDPMYSKLMFSQSAEDSVFDGYLNTREIYGLRLPADMVVLSACNTGKKELLVLPVASFMPVVRALL